MNIFELKRLSEILILPERKIWDRLEEHLAPEEIFIAQGDKHEDIDFDLIQKIDDFLFPILGNYEQNKEWAHSLLCNLDGVRSISFNISYLSNRIITGLQGQLINKAKDFCILLNIHRKFSSDEDNKIGTVFIFHNKIIFSTEVANANAQ